MNTNDDIMNERKELLLKILSCVNVIQSKIKFVKMVHFVCKMLEENHKHPPFNFGPNKFGVYSKEIEPAINALEQQGYVKKSIDHVTGRQDFYAVHHKQVLINNDISELESKIENMIKILNQYSKDSLVALSYEMFPETTTNSMIKPSVVRTIDELRDTVTDPEAYRQNNHASPSNTRMALSPPFNDLDMRIAVMESIGLDELPIIDPNSIDESAGILANTSLLKKYDFKKLLENDRRY